MKKHNKSLLVIALFKWVKGCLLVLLALGLLRLLHRDVGEVLEHVAKAVRIDPDNHYLAELLSKARLLDDTKLAVFSGLTFAYSALFFVEGTGLFFEKRWAEYLTIIATASLMPIELYELLKQPSFLKGITLAANLAIVIVLIVVARRQGKTIPSA